MIHHHPMCTPQTLSTIDGLRTLFDHYAKQNLNVRGRGDYTFEDIKEDQGVITLHKLTAMLTDFEIAAHPKVKIMIEFMIYYFLWIFINNIESGRTV
jgi:hypothetical protein